MNGVKILISVIAFALLGACSTVKLSDKARPPPAHQAAQVNLLVPAALLVHLQSTR
jgi:hypothetical protein